MFGFDSKKNNKNTVTDAVGSAPEALERDAGKLGTVLIQTLDKAMHWQTSAVTGYVEKLHKSKPNQSPAEVQKRIDAHFLNIVTGTGGAAGGAALIPGIGFFTGMAAAAGESLFFLDAAAWHALASASLRGIDITEPERRRSLILVSMSGSAGTALIASAFGGESLRKKAKVDTTAMISRMGIPQLGSVNKLLIKAAKKRLLKNARLALIGKIMPLGIGAVLGATANRKLGNSLINSTRSSLGPLPTDWTDFEKARISAEKKEAGNTELDGANAELTKKASAKK